MKSRLLALLYPPKCIFCGALLEAEEGVCSRCGPKLPVTDDGSCAQEGDWFRQCVSPFFLEGPVREAIHRYKFQHQEFNGVVLGRWMGRCARTHFSGTFDLITWVPVSRKRRWERGFDQSGILAKEVARAYGGAAVQTLKKLRLSASVPDRRRRSSAAGLGPGVTACPVPGSCPAGGYCWWTM